MRVVVQVVILHMVVLMVLVVQVVVVMPVSQERRQLVEAVVEIQLVHLLPIVVVLV